MKRCSLCRTEKTPERFQRDRQKRDSLSSRCKDCLSESRARPDKVAKQRIAHREYREAHRLELREYQREYYNANREKILDANRLYRRSNPDKIRTIKRAEYEANKASHAEQGRRWRKNHPLAWSEYDRRRRAQKRNSRVCLISESDIRSRFAVFGDRCAYCGATGRLTVDHVVPLARGGMHILSNIRPACKPCNSQKRSMPPREWLGRVTLRRSICHSVSQ